MERHEFRVFLRFWEFYFKGDSETVISTLKGSLTPHVIALTLIKIYPLANFCTVPVKVVAPLCRGVTTGNRGKFW